MPLAAGTHIGAYEVIASLGAGGMGEVYRARDTRLNRDVALKIVPEAFALDADRLARFQREAQVLASLNHPNIAAIYGLEGAMDGPPEGGHYIRALVLELVEGETLADRLARGPIPLDEALPLARQIAEALESAHDQGVIHRDLKPANIKVRDDGTVKVLDFGLAKMLEPGSGAGDQGSGSLSLSPTITTPAMTQLGMILGTAAYMAPEQARGKAADRRSDVWAFGCVLFEMLTGKQTFAGEDVTDVIAAVVRGEPAWDALPKDLPPAIRLLLQRCLEKDRRKRIGDISGVLFVLREPALATAAPVPAALPSPSTRRPWRTAALLGAALAGGAAIAAAAAWILLQPAPPNVSRLVMTTGNTEIARNVVGRHVAIAPDASSVAFIGSDGSVPMVYVRRLDSYDVVRVAPAAVAPFYRPDGREIGFFSQGVLRRVSVTGGPSVEVTRVEGQTGGGSWGDDGTIVFTSSAPKTGLMRVTPGGGKIEVLTEPEAGTDHVLPHVLPGAKAVLFTIRRTAENAASAQVAVLDLRASPPQTKILVRGGSDARYLSSGHLLYLAGESLRVMPFDLSRLEPTVDTATPALAGMATLVTGLAGEFDVSATGTLAYLLPRAATAAGRTLVWVDRTGREQPIPAPPRPYLYPRLSPDGTRIAVDVREGDSDIWVWDLQRNGPTRVTRDPGLDRTPVWENNEEILFSSMAEGTATIFRQRADGTGKPERLTDTPAGEGLFPGALAGTRLLISTIPTTITNGDVLTLDLSRTAGTTAGRRQVQPLVVGPAGEMNGSVSPDGRWLAYQSDESGSLEVYVQPYGNGATGLRATVSNTGGLQPRWSANGQELFYISGGSEMMAVKVGRGNTWSGAAPVKLFDASKYFLGGGTTGLGANPFFNYDIAPNDRFLMVKSNAGASGAPIPDDIRIVEHWTEELKRLGR
jgi:serine/threonine-protein kinase